MQISNKNCCHFNFGKLTNIALVFSTPGFAEQKNNLPISGATGKNLEKLLVLLRKHKPFSNYFDIYDFRITNSAISIEYKRKTGKTEASNKEILKDKNKQRLLNELNDITDYIICFGVKAKVGVSKIEDSLKPKVVIYTRHLSPRSINRIPDGINFVYNEIISKI